jgi:hypothetical protein
MPGWQTWRTADAVWTSVCNAPLHPRKSHLSLEACRCLVSAYDYVHSVLRSDISDDICVLLSHFCVFVVLDTSYLAYLSIMVHRGPLPRACGCNTLSLPLAFGCRVRLLALKPQGVGCVLWSLMFCWCYAASC